MTQDRRAGEQAESAGPSTRAVAVPGLLWAAAAMVFLGMGVERAVTGHVASAIELSVGVVVCTWLLLTARRSRSQHDGAPTAITSGR